MLIHEDNFKNIFNTIREAILIMDENMRVLSANRSFFTIFEVDAANTIGSLLYDLGNGQWDIPHLRVLLGVCRTYGITFNQNIVRQTQITS